MWAALWMRQTPGQTPDLILSQLAETPDASIPELAQQLGKCLNDGVSPTTCHRQKMDKNQSLPIPDGRNQLLIL
ncbi:winged helix-turn-helix domain-containing protein [Polaromonas sp. P1(28)-13]|nr:winged helix-turn-helix domain-containing protein [Polaromonas sp. P1(28)-13]